MQFIFIYTGNCHAMMIQYNIYRAGGSNGILVGLSNELFINICIPPTSNNECICKTRSTRVRVCAVCTFDELMYFRRFRTTATPSRKRRHTLKFRTTSRMIIEIVLFRSTSCPRRATVRFFNTQEATFVARQSWPVCVGLNNNVANTRAIQ